MLAMMDSNKLKPMVGLETSNFAQAPGSVAWSAEDLDFVLDVGTEFGRGRRRGVLRRAGLDVRIVCSLIVNYDLGLSANVRDLGRTLHSVSLGRKRAGPSGIGL